MIPIIIPSYEPDERLLVLLDKLKRETLAPVIIVDDGSSAEYQHFFDSAENEYEAIVLRHKENCGKGRALKTAFEYCLKQYQGLVGCITADSDGQHTENAIAKCKVALQKQPEHLILGVRNFDEVNVPAKSQFGNKLTRTVFKVLYKTTITDTQTGLRGISANFMQILLEVAGERFEFETRMLIKAIEENVQIDEVEIETIYDSKENHSTHFRPIADSIRIYRVFGFSFGKFLVSSFSSSILDIGLFHIFCIILQKIIGGISYVAWATIGARVISAIYNYCVNYFYVFNSKQKHEKSAMRYFALAAVQMSCSAALTTLLFSITGDVLEVLIKIPVDVGLFFVSYQIQKRFVYK